MHTPMIGLNVVIWYTVRVIMLAPNISIEALEIQEAKKSFRDTRSRVVGGSDVSLDTYPWFVKTMNGPICGGTLISHEYILTAGHCIDDDADDEVIDYSIGRLCLGSSRNNCGQFSETLTSEKFYLHPSYNDISLDNDFALVRLNGTSITTPANIDTQGLSLEYEPTKELWAIGFGLQAEGGGILDLPNDLQHVDVKYVSDDYCEQVYDWYNPYKRESMMCASDIGKDACSGDSGGPLYDELNNVVVGVTSWGLGCARESYPGIYSRIANRFSWIQGIVCNHHNEDTKPDWCIAKSTRQLLGTIPCDPDTMKLISVEATGKKINWNIKAKDGDDKWSLIVVKDIVKGDDRKTEHRVHEYCLPKNECYKLKVTTRNGSYHIKSWNYTLRKQDDVVGKRIDKRKFGDC